jgi:hypothetical protein
LGVDRPDSQDEDQRGRNLMAKDRGGYGLSTDRLNPGDTALATVSTNPEARGLRTTVGLVKMSFGVVGLP